MRKCLRRARRLRCRMPVAARRNSIPRLVVAADLPVAEATATNGNDERRKARVHTGLLATLAIVRRSG